MSNKEEIEKVKVIWQMSEIRTGEPLNFDVESKKGRMKAGLWIDDLRRACIPIDAWIDLANEADVSRETRRGIVSVQDMVKTWRESYQKEYRRSKEKKQESYNKPMPTMEKLEEGNTFKKWINDPSYGYHIAMWFLVNNEPQKIPEHAKHWIEEVKAELKKPPIERRFPK